MGKIGVMADKETSIYFKLGGVKNTWVVKSQEEAVKTFGEIKAKQLVSLVIATEPVFDLVDTVIQHRKSLHHTYCIGPGKLDEVKQLTSEKGIEAVLFANRLPGSQVFKIQKVLGGTDINVIDRNMLILEVFDRRAMTKEAKLQIELAKLKYTFSWGKEFLRLKGILGEQVGWSGPGEYPYADYERGEC